MENLGPGLRKLKDSLELSDAEVAQLAETYSDKELAGPAEFVAFMISQTADPQLTRLLGDARTIRMKVELTDLLLKTKAVLLADGPDALGRYLDNHPWLNYLK